MRQIPVVTGDGTRLHVEERGAPDAPLTVVFLHGWSLDRRAWGRQVVDVPAASGVPVRVVSYDHRGHGLSDPPRPGTATIAQLGDDLADVLAAAAPDGPVVLAGHSMGGMTIMALAERHPAVFAARVAGCAFVSTSSGGLSSNTTGLPVPVARMLRRAERAFGRRMVARGNRPPGRLTAAVTRPVLRSLLFGPAAGPVEVNLTMELVAAHWPATFAAFRDTLDEHERHAALVGCDGMPVSVLCGSADRLTPLAHSRRIAEAIPGSELVVYPGAGHMLPLERPTEVTERLAALVRAAAAARDAAAS
jgi:pimeloyl-ACP methyl ester carboxylesterase